MSTLFATTVANAKPQDRDYKLSDGGALHLLVRANGAKLWRLHYRYLEKYRTLAFGAWPDVSLADARGKRDEARRLIAAGLDPSHEEKVARAKAKVEENDTFKTVAKEWIAKNEREDMAEITLSKIRWLLDKAYQFELNDAFRDSGWRELGRVDPADPDLAFGRGHAGAG